VRSITPEDQADYLATFESSIVIDVPEVVGTAKGSPRQFSFGNSTPDYGINPALFADIPALRQISKIER
jgi:hypothetical protein